MKPVVHALCLLIGLGLAGFVVAEQGATGPREVAPPVAQAPARQAAGDEPLPESAANTGADHASPTGQADAAVPARQSDKLAEAQPGTPRDSLWLLLLQLLRSPR